MVERTLRWRRGVALPVEVIDADLAGMTSLRSPTPFIYGREGAWLSRDYCMLTASNDYSVNPRCTGLFLEVGTDRDQAQIVAKRQPAGNEVNPCASGQLRLPTISLS